MQPVPSGWHTLAGGAAGGGDVVSGGVEVEVTGGVGAMVTGGVEVMVAGDTESGAVGEVGFVLAGGEPRVGEVVLAIAGDVFTGDDGWIRRRWP